MGNESSDAFPGDGDGPVRRVEVSAYSIDRNAVTNAQFAAFVEQTGYLTDAERFGWSYVFAHLLDDHDRDRAVAGESRVCPGNGVTGPDTPAELAGKGQ